MATRIQTGTKPSNGSKPIHTERGEADVTEKVTQSFGSTLDTFSTFGQVSQRIGGELLEQGTSAVRDGLEVSAKVSGAVLDATKHTFQSFSTAFEFTAFDSTTFNPLSGWSRLLDTSATAYTDYATRLAASAEDATEKINDAIRVLSDEVQANAARITR